MNIQVLTKAYYFASLKHKNQRRKGEGAEPYINHPAEVADILARAQADWSIIIAGVLHDTIEDTDTTYDELVKEFGQKIADIVTEVTDDKTLPKAKRKQLQIEKMPGKSQPAQMVKIADKIANLSSVITAPPKWELSRKVEYFEWARNVVNGARGASKILEDMFDQVYADGIEILNKDIR